MAPDDRNIEALFSRHARGVGSYFLARLGDAELAEELTSRTFVAVVANFPQCRTSPAAWLWTIVRNELARHLRDRKQHQALDEQAPSTQDSPQAQAQQREEQLRMRQAMESLDEPAHGLVYMKFFQQMSNQEIAAATGRGASNVGVILHRAMKQLRGLLGDCE